MDFNKIVNRAKGIIVSPASEWEIIVSENEDKTSIVSNYALPLIVIAALTSIIGGLLAPRFISASMSYTLTTAVFAIIIPIASIYISSFVIDALAPSFGTEKNINAAFRLVIYSSTPVYVASIVANIHWTLGIVGLFGLYSIYLYWLGISQVMKTPEDKKVSYVVVSFLVLFGVYFLLGLIVSSVIIGSVFLN